MIDQLRDAADPAASQLRRNHEQAQGDRLEQRPSEDQDVVPDGGPGIFIFAIIISLVLA